MKSMLEETLETEKVPIEIKESFRSTIKRSVKKELRLIRAVMRSAFKDPLTLLKWMFSVGAVDRGIRPEAQFFENEPEKPNGVAVIACHGFAATPEIFREIGPLLAEEGYYFRSIRLSGHGTTVGHMAKTSGEHWFASVVWHYQQVASEYSRIFYLGHSLGGTLGLLLSTIYPIETIIALSTPVNLNIGPAKFIRQISVFIKYWPRSSKKQKMIMEAGVQTYLKSPLYAIAGIFEVGKVLRKRADKLTLPVFYVRASLDHHNLLDQPEEFRKFFSKTPVEFRDAENSTHSLTLGPEKDMVNEWIIEWFARYL